MVSSDPIGTSSTAVRLTWDVRSCMDSPISHVSRRKKQISLSTETPMRGMVLRAGLLPALVLVTAGSVGVAHAEIAPMTRERLAEAEQAGRQHGGDDLIVYKDVCRTRTSAGNHAFDVVITTPFGAVADSVFESRKQGAPLDLEHRLIEPSESQSVIVSVDPVTLFGGEQTAPPASVRSVILRREGVVIEARRADTHEVRFPSLKKQAGEYRGGAFYFPLEPFASKLGALEVVVLLDSDTPGAEAVLELKKPDLAKMR